MTGSPERLSVVWPFGPVGRRSTPRSPTRWRWRRRSLLPGATRCSRGRGRRSEVRRSRTSRSRARRTWPTTAPPRRRRNGDGPTHRPPAVHGGADAIQPVPLRRGRHAGVDQHGALLGQRRQGRGEDPAVAASRAGAQAARGSRAGSVVGVVGGCRQHDDGGALVHCSPDLALNERRTQVLTVAGRDRGDVAGLAQEPGLDGGDLLDE